MRLVGSRSPSTPRLFAQGALGVSLLGLLPALALGAEPLGPEFGSNKFEASVRHPQGDLDVDDFVGSLATGETLSVTLKSAKFSSLLGTIEVIDPDGDPRAVTLVTKKNGAQVQLKKFAIDQTGAWTIRVRSADQSQGDYTVQFKIGKSKPVKLKKQSLGGAQLQRTHEFGALEGSELTLTLAGKKKLSAVSLVRLTDANGDEVPAPGGGGTMVSIATVKGTKTSLKKQTIAAGDGNYAATVSIDSGTGEYKLTIKTKPRVRPKGKKATVLSDTTDPYIDPVADPFVAAPGFTMRVTGVNFAPGARVFFGDVQVPASDIDISSGRNFVDVVPPPGLEGTTVSFTIINADGQAATRDAFVVFPPFPVLDQAQILTGTVIGTNEVPFAGGHRVRVTGSNLDVVTDFTFGGDPIVPSSRTNAAIEFIAPARTAGTAGLTVADEFGRTSAVADILHYKGFIDETVARLPGGDTVDDLGAVRGALGDVDADGRPDDLIIGSFGKFAQYDRPVADNLPGTREEYLRTVFNDPQSQFLDRTDTHVPAAFTDTEQVANWNARDLALGDLDGDFRQDVVTVGTFTYEHVASSPFHFDDFDRVHVFRNRGTGSFELMESWEPGSGFVEPTYAYYPNPDPMAEEPEVAVTLRAAMQIPDTASAVDIGDLDGDGDPDVVVGFREAWSRSYDVDASFVDYTQSPPYIDPDDIVFVDVNYFYPAVRILDNAIDDGNGLVDVTAQTMPDIGDDSGASLPSFASADLTLGDVDNDGDLDVVTTFNNPAAANTLGPELSYGYVAFGNYYYEYDAASAPVVATRVLLNNNGSFTDRTGTWMPDASAPEFWQAHRVVLADLDDDGRLDMLLLHRRALDSFTRRTGGTHDRHALRILRNTGSAFEDVTVSALPGLAAGNDDTLRGDAVVARDLNHDGFVDLIVSTTEVLRDDTGALLPSTRVLFGRAGLTFIHGNEFFPGLTVETGEADDLLIGDIERTGNDSLFLLTEGAPTVSPGGERLRIYTWQE